MGENIGEDKAVVEQWPLKRAGEEFVEGEEAIFAEVEEEVKKVGAGIRA